MSEQTAAEPDLITVTVERIEGRWSAQTVEMLGCGVMGDSPDDCLARLPDAIHRFQVLNGMPQAPVELDVIEMIRCWEPEPGYEVNAFFASDAVPLTEDDVERAARVLERSRATLYAAIEGLSNDDLRREVEDGWSIARVLLHVGIAEWWYLDRLGYAFPRERLPDDEVERLERSRTHLMSALPELVGETRIVERHLEIWSARKIVRRACYHERDHIEHIGKLRALL